LNYTQGNKPINGSIAEFITDIITSGLDTLQYLFSGETDTLLKTLESSCQRLAEQFRRWDCNIVLPEDQRPGVPIENERGSIMHLAYISHSISRQKLYPEVKTELDQAMESEHNPNYQGPKIMKITIDVIEKMLNDAPK
jgi:hypothetical protein